MEEDLLEAFYERQASEDNWLVRLRMGDGLDRAAFQELLEDIDRLREDYAGSTSIPKRLALCLFELTYGMESCASLYPGRAGTALMGDAYRLREAVLELLDCGRDADKLAIKKRNG